MIISNVKKKRQCVDENRPTNKFSLAALLKIFAS